MIRKTAKDYKKEFDNLQIKTEALKARIYDRLLTLCNKFPDAVINDDGCKAHQIVFTSYKEFETYTLIKTISYIENWISEQNPIKQTEINFK